MNYDPKNFFYQILSAHPLPGVNIVLVRLVDKHQVRVFYNAAQTIDSAGLIQHMDSMTDELLMDFFEKKKKPKNPDGRQRGKQMNSVELGRSLPEFMTSKNDYGRVFFTQAMMSQLRRSQAIINAQAKRGLRRIRGVNDGDIYQQHDYKGNKR